MVKRPRTMGAKKALPLYQAPRPNAAGGPWPVQKFCTLTYDDIVQVSYTAGSGNFVFSTNGMYDPNITGIGHQPLYFDQLGAIYNHYTVLSSNIEVQPMGSTVSKDYHMTLHVDDNGVDAGSGPATVASRPGAKSISFNPAVSTPATTRMSWSAAQQFGPNVQNNQLFRGNPGTNPTEQAYYFITISDLGLSTSTIPMRVKITFRSVWTELRTIAGS